MEVKLNIDENLNGEPYVEVFARQKDAEINMIMDSIKKIAVLPTLTVYQGDRKIYVRLSDILRIHTEGKRVVCVTLEGTYQIRKRIYELENVLPKNLFIKISSAEIINLSYVKKFELPLSGTCQVLFKNDSSTYASRRYIQKIQEVLEK